MSMNVYLKCASNSQTFFHVKVWKSPFFCYPPSSFITFHVYLTRLAHCQFEALLPSVTHLDTIAILTDSVSRDWDWNRTL